MPEPDRPGPVAPRFSIVAPCPSHELHFEAFIASIESQHFDLGLVEVVMVDDGSNPSVSRILSHWQLRRPDLVTIVTEDDGDQAAARNAGIQHARGEWLTFPQADGLLASDYLAEVATVLDHEPDVGMVSTRRVVFEEVNDRVVPDPLQTQFAAANRVRNLDETPDLLPGGAQAFFVRREIVSAAALEFDHRIRSDVEDGHFCVSYLLHLESPTVAFVGSTAYTSRKHVQPGGSPDVFEHGYLDALRQARRRRGTVPDWLGSFVLHELSACFEADDAVAQGSSAAYGEGTGELHRLLAEIVTYLDPGVIRTFDARRFDALWREVLLHSFDDHPWHSDFALVGKLDTGRRLVRVTYRYTHNRPEERFLVNGVVVVPVFEKSRSVVLFNRPVLLERIAWLPAGAIRVMLDGSYVDVRTREPERPRHTLPLSLIRDTFVPRLVDLSRERARAAARRQPLKPSDRLLIRIARSRLVGGWFANAWVLMDRIDDADDSAELLFRHLRTHRRKVNAWFVIRRGTPDHRRLRREGYKRVIPYGSLRWKLLMLNCRHLVSSHADGPIVQPREIIRLGRPGWQFCFLQHGVTKDDLSRWLNPKDIDVLVTNTPAEHAAFVADGTPYHFTEREATLAGMPRFDALLKAGELVPPADRDLILLAPTWRSWLMVSKPDGKRTILAVDDFSATDFGINWLGLARSPQLHRLANEHGLRVGLLLHPNLQPIGHRLGLPEHVDLLRFEGEDVRSTFARARVLVTDYSSMAFDAAYIDRPVTYFQFDRARVLGGEHVGQRGYFDYERDGFGPVATSLEQVIPAIVETVEAGPSPRPEYLARIAEAYPARDGQCAERVFRAIRASTRRWDAQTAHGYGDSFSN